MQVFEGEVGLDNPSGLYSGSEHILLGWNVVGLGYPLNVIQVAVVTE